MRSDLSEAIVLLGPGDGVTGPQAMHLNANDQHLYISSGSFGNKLSQNESVAFLAYLSEPITNLQSTQHVVFDKVITNVGNAYNKFSGHFIAPVDGVYVFFVMLSNVAGKSVTVIVLRNGLWIGKVAAYGSITDKGLLVTSTSAIPVELQYGDEVWVQNEYTYLAHEEVAGYKQSSFSGHLITSF
ncbi:complement C1q tumor necrosis factor-related protein 3-like [Ruditapes philippinarum]|uniref:complement C1q tumor necrosis factor-related protein 3-like n=1 Tax=Ruditapes philippinarum TaxID=129788 RepID=UPI00295A5EE7|nr:complement C1q tumor necrosis factor-related protein 3-like [Ruditapes philippinarum]